jgi:SWI/SNF-related matrix-associated actin-dependent regulator 1 of chromatin subfamily A
MPFQEAGSDWLALSPRAMLAWEPGVGKTPTAVRACVKVSARRILVICPPIATSVWRRHFEDWSNYRDIRVLDAVNSLKPYTFMEGTGVRIVAYSRVNTSESVVKAAMKRGWDVAILDEGHYLKNPEALRTQRVYGKKHDLVGGPLEKAAFVWVLTGTPVLNHPAEFWPHLHALAVDTIKAQGAKPFTYDQFVDRYCVAHDTPYGRRIVGAKNIHELAGKIAWFMDRKRIADVIKDLPPLRIVDHPLPADTYVNPNLRKELAEAIAQSGFDEALDDDTLLAAVQAGGVAFSTVRRLIGLAKIEAVADLVMDMLDDSDDDKIIVFAHHRDVVNGLAEQLKKHKALVIHGGTSPVNRDAAIDLFQNDPKYRLIILAIEAAGESITLHASHNVIIAEPSPVPMKNAQAIARAYRRGQRNAVLARFVLLPGTLDARLMAIIARKTRDIAKLLDGASEPSPLLTGAEFPDDQ